MEQAVKGTIDVKLKVMEALQEEAYKGIVRVDSQTMRDLGVRPGDIISIEGGRKTVALVERAYPTDVGQAVIRMDGLLRRNAKTSIGEMVSVERVEVKEAKHITIAPAQQNIMIQADPESLKLGLIGKPVLKGDQVSLDFGRVFGNSLGPGFPFRMGMSGLRFIIVNSDPKQAVVITQNTELTLNPRTVEVNDEKVIEVTYEDIGGLFEEVKKIREMVELPLKHPEIFEKLGIEAPKGVLLHGPPGTGKTLLARTVANETNVHFIHLDGPSVMSKFVGEAEKKIRDIFEEAEKNSPSIVFIDEIDAIAPKREDSYGEVERRVVAQLLAVMDGMKSRGRVVVIAATNRPNSLDPALRRPGRFDREIELGVPKPAARREILKIHTRNMPIDGVIYVDVVANNFSNEINKFLEENGLDIGNLEKEIISTRSNFDKSISEVKSEKLKVEKELAQIKNNPEEQTFLDKLLRKLTSLDSKSKELELERTEKLEKIEVTIALKESRLLKLEKIKKLIASKQELDSISKELLEIYHILVLRPSNDPRTSLIEKEKDKKELKFSASLEEIKSLDLLAREIWNKDSNFWTDIRNKGKERDLEELARVTHGFVGADLEVLCKEAAMVVLRKLLPDMQYKKDEPIPKDLLEKLIITMDDFKEALKMVRPSAMREVFIETPSTKWDDIGGLEEVKQEIKEAVELPLKNPAVFKKMGVRPPRGILLYGPPGTGKTLLAKAVAHESEANFILINGPELLSKWVGESERGVRKIFEKARQASPSIIFFDEIDSIAPKRGRTTDTDVTERMVNQLLTEIDGLQELNDVVVIGATNRPDRMDPALLRPGRFDRFVFVPVPDAKSRIKIFEIHSKGMPLAKDVVLKTLADKAINYVGADVESICREAAMLALRKDINATEVNMKNFLDAMKKVRASVDKESLDKYEALGEDIATARADEIRSKKDVMSYMG